MRSSKKSFLVAIKCAALGLILSPLANAQVFKVEGSKPEFEELLSPQIDAGGTDKGFRPKDWLEVEASFTVQMRPESPSKTADRVLFKWYVAVENPDKKNTYLLLTKDITLVNVPLNDSTYASIYLSPASLTRLTGSDKAGARAINRVGYEVLINGEKIAEESSDNKPGWWNKASAGISRSETVPLLSKIETPFANLWWDRYAEILVEKN